MPAYPALPLQEVFIEESLRQPPGTSLDVFISYSRANSGFARKLNDALQMQGKRTWFDQENITAGTADFQQEIYQGIASSDTFLFILSPRSIVSPYCADEVEYAAKLNKRMVTLLYQPIDPAQLHPELAKVQWLDFNRQEGDFSANFADLLRILDMDSEHLHAHTRILLRSIEWDEKWRKESLLLRDDELVQAEQWLAQSVGKMPQATELQYSYITTGRKVEDANHQATQILREAAKQGEQAQQRLQEAEQSLQIATRKGRRRLLLGTAAGAIGLMMVSLSSLQVWRVQNQIEMAEIQLKVMSAQENFAEGEAFKALLTVLETRKMYHDRFEKNLQNPPAEKSNLQFAIMAALQQITSSILEENTLQGHRGIVWSISFRGYSLKNN